MENLNDIRSEKSRPIIEGNLSRNYLLVIQEGKKNMYEAIYKQTVEPGNTTLFVE